MLFIIFPICLTYKFNNFDFHSFKKALFHYEFEPKKTYFVQLFTISGETLSAPIPFSVYKSFIIVKNNGISKPFDVVVNVGDVKVVKEGMVDSFDYIRDLYNKISYILTYVNFRFSPHYRDRDYDFTVNIFEDLSLNNILFVNSSEKIVVFFWWFVFAFYYIIIWFLIIRLRDFLIGLLLPKFLLFLLLVYLLGFLLIIFMMLMFLWNILILFHHIIMDLCYKGKVAIGKARYLLNIVF